MAPSVSGSNLYWRRTINRKTEHLSKRCRGSCQSSLAQGHPVSWDVQQWRRHAVADREQGRPEIGWLWKSVFGHKMPINFENWVFSNFLYLSSVFGFTLSVDLPDPKMTWLWARRQYFCFHWSLYKPQPQSLWAQDNSNSIPQITLSDMSPCPFHRFPTRGDKDRPVAM